MAGVESSPYQLGVPYDHISIRVLGDTALLRVEVEDFCCVAAGDSYKSILVHFAAVLRGEETHKATSLSKGPQRMTTLYRISRQKVSA